MDQRTPRLGDLVDDYCPRERRLTNHAIVAIVEDAIRQTRCTTCEAEHVYKGGKVPVRKKKDEKAALYEQVLAGVTASHTVATVPESQLVPPAPDVVEVAAIPAPPAAPPVEEGWTLHRTLIRASLPRNDSHPPTPRPIPEFTMHQRNVRGSQQFRQGGAGQGWDRSANGNGSGPGHPRGPFRGDGQPDQPGAPNGPRPGGSRRRPRNKNPRPAN